MTELTANPDRSLGAAALPRGVRAYLVRYVAAARAFDVLRSVGFAITFGLGWMLVWCLVDRWAGLSPVARRVVSGLDLMGMALIVLRAVLPALSPARWGSAAQAIEAAEPAFGQRLETVVSQSAAGADLRGSGELLEQLTAEVEREVARHPVRRLLPWSDLAFPWAYAALVVMVAGVLGLVPVLGLGRLAMRFVRPDLALEAVTTTRLFVTPGDAEVVEGAGLTIRATVERLGDRPPIVHVSTDGLTYAAAVMSPEQGAFGYAVPAVDRDLVYYVTGGDATTPQYRVRALHPPAVREYRVRYTYPAYTRREPLEVKTPTGQVEAPTGTVAEVRVVASEALREATLKMGDRTIASEPTDSDEVRKFTLTLAADARAELTLVSARGVGSRPGTQLVVRGIPDRPPLVRILQPASDLHLHPRDVLPVSYEALDDFGVERLVMQLQVNAAAPTTRPVVAVGDPRRLGATIDVDLATLPLKIGDVLGISVTGDDALGQRGNSEVRHVLISPRSVDLDTYLRLADVDQAANLVGSLAEGLQSTAKALDDARQQQEQQKAIDPPTYSRVYQSLGTATEAGTLARQALLRALRHGADAATAAALARVADELAVARSVADQAGARLASRQQQDQVRDRLNGSAERMRQVRQVLETVAQGEQAAIVLADRANVRELAKPTQQDANLLARVKQTLDRAAADAEAGIKQLGVNPQAPDIDQLLTAKVEAGKQAIRAAAAPADLVGASREWAELAGRPETLPGTFAARLEMASAVEAVRGDGDAGWARDLELAAKAARRSEGPTATTGPFVELAAAARRQYPQALEALAREHALRRGGAQGKSDVEVGAILSAGEEARARMKAWAAEADLLTAAAEAVSRAHDARALRSAAMEANARMARRDYASAAAVDARVPTALPDATEAARAREDFVHAARSMRNAERVDRTAVQQAVVAEQTRRATAAELPRIARTQQQVAENIEAIRGEAREAAAGAGGAGGRDTREEAMATVRQVQEQLAGMPQRLAEARDAARALRRAQQQAASARREADASTGERRRMAFRVVAQAERSVNEADQNLTEVQGAISPQVAEVMAEDLFPFAPETAGAANTVDGDLVPALRAVDEATRRGDNATLDRADERAREAIGRVQDNLREAQAQLAQKDPLVAAKWFARAAAAALAQQPPDVNAARAEQGSASEALARAWSDSIRQAALGRLAGSARLASLYAGGGGAQAPGGGGGERAAGPAGELPSAAADAAPGREWGTLRAREADLSAALRDPEPPGYQEALRAYFQALSRPEERR